MDELEQKLGAVLNDPEMMGKLMSMAQALGAGEGASPPQDPGLLRQITELGRKSGIDKDQQTLLRALEPYLAGNRIRKLEKAMRAAKMARLASGVLSGGMSLGGR